MISFNVWKKGFFRTNLQLNATQGNFPPKNGREALKRQIRRRQCWRPIDLCGTQLLNGMVVFFKGFFYFTIDISARDPKIRPHPLIWLPHHGAVVAVYNSFVYALVNIKTKIYTYIAKFWSLSHTKFTITTLALLLLHIYLYCYICCKRNQMNRTIYIFENIFMAI